MRTNYRSLSLISENLGILYGNGISIILAIELLGELPLNKYYKDSIINVRDRVAKGDNLCKAFGLYAKLYPIFFTGLIALGERSGELSKVLKSLSNYYGKKAKIRNEIISAFIYPSFLLIIMLVTAIFFILVLIPNIYNAMKSINSTFPYIIEKLYSIRELLLKNPIVTITYLFCYGILIPGIIINCCKRKFNIAPITLKLKVVKEYYEYLFILNLSIILNSAISLHTSLEHCASNTEELILKNELLRVNEELLLGNELSKSLERNVFLSKQSKAIIRIGETSGSLALIVKNAEGQLEESLNNSINKLTMMIQPIITIIMAVVIGGFIVTLIMPLLTMMYK